MNLRIGSRFWSIFMFSMAWMASGLFAMTLAEIETEVRLHARDTSASASLSRYSDTVLDGWINQTQTEVNNLTWVTESTQAISLIANTTYYALNSDFIATKRVMFTDSANTTIKLKEFSERVTFERNPDFEASTTGDPFQYFTMVDRDSDSTVIGVLPVPTQSSGTLTVYYIANPTAMSADSDVPFNGQENLVPYHNTLIYGTVFKIKLIEGKTEEAKIYGDMYNAMVTTMREKFNTRPDYNPSLQGSPR